MGRLSRDCTITEKIDGTNAQIHIIDTVNVFDDADALDWWLNNDDFRIASVGGLDIYAGSRTRYITPGKTTDNFGFAAWVKENSQDLAKLGPGRHYGEWWGKGIQRTYGLDERRFSLFHNHGIKPLPYCVSVVPKLYEGPFWPEEYDWDGVRQCPVTSAMHYLKYGGSQAVLGFMKPEGIVIYHHGANVSFKKTFENDATGKEAA